MLRADDFDDDAAPVRYPDPRLVSLDDRFNKLKLGNTPVQRIHHSKNTLWTEGPAWNGVGRYLIWSDIPNNIQQRLLEDDGHVNTIEILQTTAMATRLICRDDRFRLNI